MRVLLSEDVADIRSFLDLTHYPHQWGDPALRASLRLVVMDGPVMAAVVWMSEAPLAPGWLQLHAAALPDYRGRWLTQDVADQIHAAARLCGAIGTFSDVPDDRWPLFRRLLRRYGYDAVGRVQYRHLEEPNGQAAFHLFRAKNQDT
jgi:hypothetical protein